MDYKDTLLLPKTEFPMRGNLGVKEVEIQQFWKDIDLYNKVLLKNENNKEFFFHDGPPYANGSIHIGHALNKILKDIVVRYKTMQGFYTPFIPGWDTHGLPIENAVSKKGVDRKKISATEFIQKCKEYALEQVETQKGQMKRLGIMADFDHPYITLTPDYEARQIRVFKECVKKNYIYRGSKPVYWSYSSESALAEAEVEYENVDSKSIYFTFIIKDSKDQDLIGANLLVWTTTPWTLPANLAVSANPNIVYVLILEDNKKYVLSKNLLPGLKEKLELKQAKILKEFKGVELENTQYIHCLYEDKILPVILGDHVLDTDGTGLVHTAPGHGMDDYKVGLKYNLEILSPINEKGVLTEEAGIFKGLFYEDANDEIIKFLKEKDQLLKLDIINHSYPHDWRTGKPIIFRSTPQWFFSIKPIEDKILESIKDVSWYPKWGEVRLSNMIKGRNDWCISRQRLWGVPIPVFYNEDDSPILDENVIEHIANLFEKHGSSIWFSKTAEELLPKGYTNEKSPNNKFRKETDIMDVWFDSGTSFLTLKDGVSEIYFEGSDQYRGWFNSSLINSVAVNEKAPYKRVISHGFVLDDKGNKMSKSKGNVIDPNLMSKKYGADVLRLWAASVDYQQDVRLSEDLILKISESYRKIRNTVRYMLGNLSDFDKEKDYWAFSMRQRLDQVMSLKLYKLQNLCIEKYDNFEFSQVYREILSFITNDLSAFYLDYTKDTLYVALKNGYERKSVQSTIYDILLTLLKLLTPIIPHTASEAYQNLNYKEKEDIYLLEFPKKVNRKLDYLMESFDLFMTIREKVLKEIEEYRQQGLLGKSLSAIVDIKLSKNDIEKLQLLDADLRNVLMIAELNLIESDNFEVKVSVSNLKECKRCWNIRSLNDNDICDRCQDVMDKDYA